MDRKSWLLLLYGLPAESKSERVNLWRKLQKCGAIQFKTSAYILPDGPAHLERFQWLAKQVRDNGGEATLMQVSKIEGVSDEQIIASFNQARSRDYEPLLKDLRALIRLNRKKTSATFFAQLEKLRRAFQTVRAIDFFACPAGEEAEMTFIQEEKRRGKTHGSRPILKKADFQAREWLTRPRPEIDRVGSAWLITRFIDPEARFVFSTHARDYPNALRYDMSDAEFTHEDDRCTFETLCQRFGIQSKALRQIAEMIHDADLEDEKFSRNECVGIDLVLKGLARQGLRDEQILKSGFEFFDALYTFLSPLK
jgi:hypothetical protein